APSAASELLRALAETTVAHGTSEPTPLIAPEATASIERDAWRSLEARAQATRPALTVLRPRRAVLFALGAAAAIALAVGGGALLKRDAGPIAVVQRAYVGMMGDADAEAPEVPLEDRDIELSFAASPMDEAALVTT